MFRAHGDRICFDPNRKFPAYSYEELAEVIGDMDAAIIGMDQFDESVFAKAPRLKAVAKFGVGVDNIDVAAAGRHQVTVINAPGQNSNAVAELTIGYMIDLLRRIPELDSEVKHGKWTRFIGTEIKGKTVGLIGFGAIARLVAGKLAAFGCRVIAYDKYPDREAAAALGVELAEEDTVIETSDILSIHIPATKQSYHLFDKAKLARMKQGAVLINAARGALVDLDDLYQALQSGHLAGAAIDAFEQEPLPADAPILQCRQVILTPHTGGETREAYHNISVSVTKDIIAVLDGKKPAHLIV